MPRRGWDDRWQRFPASVPLPAEGGIASSKQRGAMADTWWSRRFTEMLESYGLGTRMQRGRRYARKGQVLSIEVRTSTLAAQVQGSRRTPYLVTISLPEPTEAQWQAIDASIAARVGFVARLMSGEMPPDLEEVFHAAGADLFPATWAALRSDCSCPDWENPCKHIAAVLYLFADQLDADPWLLLVWRGRTRDQILDGLRVATTDTTGSDPAEVAPWWPFAPGPLPDLSGSAAELDRSVEPERAEAVLDATEPLEVRLGDSSFVELLGPVYSHIVHDAAADDVDAVAASDGAGHGETSTASVTARRASAARRS